MLLLNEIICVVPSIALSTTPSCFRAYMEREIQSSYLRGAIVYPILAFLEANLRASPQNKKSRLLCSSNKLMMPQGFTCRKGFKP